MDTPIKLSSLGEIDDTTLCRAAGLFHQHGVLSIANVFSRAFVARLRDAYGQRYSSLDSAELACRHALVGDNRYMITVEVSPPFASPKLYANGSLMPLLHELLGNDCVISSFGSVLSLPGAKDQPVHFDFPPLYESEELCAALPPYAITLVVPLIDLDLSTGSTAVWQGSHCRVGAREELRELSKFDSLSGSTLPLPKMGDVFLMDFRLIHAGTANQSDHARPILYIVYSRSWFRDGKNFSEQPAIEISRAQLWKVPKKHRHLFAAADSSR